ncbi:MAG: hypothetical protein RR614_09370, partial [Eubacterium sp.]
MRGLSVFPGMVIHFDIGRDKSINALETAMTRDQIVFLTEQKDLSIEELKEKLEDLFSTRDRLITQHPHAQIKTAVAFGPELWAQLHPTAPAGFKQLEPIYGSFNMPVSPADVLIHIAAQR